MSIGAYDPETCVTAGQLRAAGVEVPEGIPDVAWIPKYAMSFGPVRAFTSQEPDRIICTASVHFNEPFRWVDVSLEVGDKKNDAP